MALFWNPKRLAKADIEENISHVENYDSDTGAYLQTVKEVECNIDFTERIGLLTETEANYYRNKLRKARDVIDKRQREELIAQKVKSEQKKTFIEQKKEQLIATQRQYTPSTPQRNKNKDFERERYQ